VFKIFLPCITHTERSLVVSRDICACLLAIGIVICTCTGAAAAGFAILQQGTAAMAEGNAFVAQADDPSAIFYNPAGLTQLQRPEIYFNNVFSSTNRYYMTPAGEYTTAKHDIFMIPAFYASYPVHERVVLGLGCFTPFGLGTTWPPEWAGRYLTTMSKLQTYNVNPVVAVKLLDNLSVAVGLDVMWSRVRIERKTSQRLGRILLTDLKSDYDGAGMGWGYNLGLLYEPVEGVKLGVSYRSEIKVSHSGKLNVANVSVVGGEAGIVYPPSVTWGLAYSRLKPFVFEFDVTWTGWSKYTNLQLNLTQPIPGRIIAIQQEKNWFDAWAFRFGGNYEMYPGMKVRAGYIYDMTPVPNSTMDPTIPDANRHIFTLGGDLEIKKFTLGFAYNFILAENRSKANVLAINGALLPARYQANGKYKSDNHSLGFSLAYKF
jgi:long-chain fatty acid transport protein